MSAAGRGTIRKAPESADEIMVKMRFDHGLCMTCNAQLFEVSETGGRRKLNPVTTPGVAMNGRCLYCHPDQVSQNPVKEEEENWEDAATVPIEEVETGEDIEDQSLPPVIVLDGFEEQRFVGVVSEGNTKKGKGVFSHVVKAGVHKDKSIVYKGEFADGFFEGHGSLRHEGKGCVLEGEWKKSEQHGHFKETLEDGSMYEGEMKNDLKDGQGTYTWADGTRYEGEWEKNMRNGYGKLVDEDGVIYEGNYKDDVLDGQGTYTWAGGDRYEGEWENDWRNGSGKLMYKNGDIYEGNWKDGKRNGQGTYSYVSGCVKHGTWKKDKYLGK